MTALIADDLFAGAGGWDLAAQALGIHARGVENMPEARATRDAAGLTTIHDDVWTFKPRYLGRELTASGLIASPPCQTFSTAGKGSGRKALGDVLTLLPKVATMTLAELREAAQEFEDERTGLVLTPLWFAIHHPYEWLAWEQVPTVLPVWEACAHELRQRGWHVWTGKLNAEQYGVPQTRTRAFLLASRLGPVAPPKPTHSRYYSRTPEKLDEGVRKWVSMAEALGWGLPGRPSPTVTGGGTETGGAEPIAKLARYSGREDWVLRTGVNSATMGPGPKRDQLMTEGRWAECHKPQERSVDSPAPTVTSQTSGWKVEGPTHMGDVYNSHGCVRSVDEPAPTMTSSMDNGNFRWHDRTLAPAGTSSTVVDPRPVSEPSATITGKGTAEWGERTERAPGPKQRDPKGVRVSVQEAGILQSFPADMPWQGNKGKQYLQCGNAVPPLLACHALGAAAVHHLAIDEEVAS